MSPSFRRGGRGAIVALLLCFACAGCGKQTQAPPPSSPPPPAPPPQVPPQDGVIQVTGTERIGWDQQPMTGGSSDGLEFAVYLDFNRMALPDLRCAARGDGTLDCSAQLPAMTPGLHVLQLASIGTRNGRLFESTRSQPVFVSRVSTLEASAVSPVPAAPVDVTATTPRDAAPVAPAGDGEVRIGCLAETSASLADLAVSAAGDVFAAERLGRVLLVRRGTATLLPALDLPDIATSAGRGLFSIALHPDYERNGLIYMLYAAQTAAAEPVFRIARGREIAGRIGELAVLLDAAPAAPDSWAVLRFGPDRRLYAALGEDREREGGEGRGTGASYDGKLLRLDDDGRPAGDNPTASPIAATVGGDPSGLLWTPERSRMILRQRRAGSEILLTEANRDAAVFNWGPSARPNALAYVAGQAPAARGYLYAGDLGGGLHRIPWPAPPDRSATSTELIAREYGAVRAVAAGADGSVYFGTANIDVTAADAAPAVKDFIVRLTPRTHPGR